MEACQPNNSISVHLKFIQKRFTYSNFEWTKRNSPQLCSGAKNMKPVWFSPADASLQFTLSCDCRVHRVHISSEWCTLHTPPCIVSNNVPSQRVRATILISEWHNNNDDIEMWYLSSHLQFRNGCRHTDRPSPIQNRVYRWDRNVAFLRTRKIKNNSENKSSNSAFLAFCEIVLLRFECTRNLPLVDCVEVWKCCWRQQRVAPSTHASFRFKYHTTYIWWSARGSLAFASFHIVYIVLDFMRAHTLFGAHR